MVKRSKTDQAAEPFSLPAGTVLRDRYQIIRLIGRDWSGFHYLASDTGTQQVIAVYEYFPQGIAVREPDSLAVTVYPDDIAAFNVGCRCLQAEVADRQTREPVTGWPLILDRFVSGQTFLSVQAYLPGRTLAEVICSRGGRLGYAEAVSILGQLLDLLENIHQIGLAQLNLSTRNIWLTENGDCQLVGFGWTQYALMQNLIAQTWLDSPFIAPEMAGYYGNIGPWTDVYAAAAVFLAMLGQPRMPGPAARMCDRSQKLRLNRGIPKAVRSILVQAWAADPTRRIQAAADFARQIQPGRPEPGQHGGQSL